VIKLILEYIIYNKYNISNYLFIIILIFEEFIYDKFIKCWQIIYIKFNICREFVLNFIIADNLFMINLIFADKLFIIYLKIEEVF
jgi:hypothetical protein